MFEFSAVPEDLPAPPPLAGLHYGVPCVFKGCSGHVHPAGGATGVVLCSPWGFEDLAMRKSWRLLAETIAQAGYPCIRFDYPGTGDSLGRMTDVASIKEWIDAVDAAADVLRLNSGVRRFVFIGQSIGAALAIEAARHRSDVAALQLVAPVSKGRSYIRELSATSRMVADRIGISHEPATGEGLSVVGFALSRAMADSLKSLDLMKIDRLPVANVTLFDNIDRKAGAEAATQLRALGVDLVVEPVEAYHLMVSDATQVQALPVPPERIVAALRRAQPLGTVPPAPAVPAFPAALVGDGFREEPVRFGSDATLFGMLCRPSRERPGAPAIVLLNRGLNPHVGWRRVSVDHARALAAAGITSLRIDVAGLGESRDAPDRPFNLIYSDLLLPDISAAVDLLAGRGHRRIALAGVCSGAYMALGAALADPRVTDVIAVNPQRFLWNPAESVDEVIRYGLRSLNDYVGDLKGGNAMRKLIRSRRRIVPAMRFLVARTTKQALARVPLRWRSLVMRTSMAARVDRFFSSLAERGTRVALVYSDMDPGLVELRNYFGPLGRDMRFGNVSLAFIPEADHNVTSTRACDALLAHMIAFAGAAAPRDERVPRAAREPQRMVCPT